MAKVEWSDAFIRLHPNVAGVRSEWWDEVQDVLSVFPAGVDYRYTRMMATDLTAVPLLDGGVLFYEDTGWDDDGALSDALETWFAEGDELGEDRDEADFVWEPPDQDPSRLHNGVYVIGSNLIRLLAASVGCREDQLNIQAMPWR